MKCGCSLTLQDEEGNTPAHLAILNRKTENALYLIEKMEVAECEITNNKSET